jgi:HD-like signal output (HDOD) protein
MFKGLFGKKSSPAASKGHKRLAPGISQAILGVVGARSIPTMASAAQKAFQLATNPKADARDFIEVIESDEGLSARVLKISNSVYFLSRFMISPTCRQLGQAKRVLRYVSGTR